MKSSTPDQYAVRQLHEEIIESFNTRDAKRLLSLHTDDIILMEQNMPHLVGKDELSKWFNKLKSGMIDFELFFNILEIEIIGEGAFVRGQVIKTTIANGKPIHITGKFISLLKKQTDGRWLRTHVMAKTDAASIN